MSAEPVHIPHLSITLQPVEASSNITHAGYDAKAKAFYVKFTSGSTIYRYAAEPDADVQFTQGLFDAFMAAESKGRFFHQRIKSWFSFDKHEPEPDPPREKQEDVS